jgi:hypothetical protein
MLHDNRDGLGDGLEMPLRTRQFAPQAHRRNGTIELS